MGLEIEIPGNMSQGTYDRVLNNFLRKAAIPGFRKGKVPRKILIQQIGPERIKYAALEELLDLTIKAAIDQEKIPFLGNVSLLSDFETLFAAFEPGQVLHLKVAVDVIPEFSVTPEQYTELTIGYHCKIYDPADVDRLILDQQKERATLIPIEDRPAQAEDIVLVDFSAVNKETNEPLEDAEGEDVQLDLSEPRFLPEFEAAIKGMTVGETKQVDVTFPEGYQEEGLANTTATFTVILKEIKERELPPLDDAFAQDCSEYDTLEELRQVVEERLQKAVENQNYQAKESAILSKLLETIDFEIPEVLIKEETHRRIQELLNRLEDKGIAVPKSLSAEMQKTLETGLRGASIDAVKQELFLRAIAKQESIEPDPEKVEEQVEGILQALGKKAPSREWVHNAVTDDLRKRDLMDWLMEKNYLEIRDDPEDDEEDEEPEASLAPDVDQGADPSSDVIDPDVIDTTATTIEDDPQEPAPEAPEESVAAIANEPAKKRSPKKANSGPSGE